MDETAGTGFDKWITPIITFLTGGGLAALAQLLLGRRKTKIEGDTQLLSTYEDQLTSLLEKGQRLFTENEALHSKYSEALMENAELSAKTVRQERLIEMLTSDTRILRNQFNELRRRQAEQVQQFEEQLNRVEQMAKGQGESKVEIIES